MIERAVVLAEGDSIEPRHLPAEVAIAVKRNDVPVVPGATMDELERYAIMKTLESVGGSTGKAAEILGVSVRKIQYKLQEYGAAPKSHVPALAVEGSERRGVILAQSSAVRSPSERCIDLDAERKVTASGRYGAVGLLGLMLVTAEGAAADQGGGTPLGRSTDSRPIATGLVEEPIQGHPSATR